MRMLAKAIFGLGWLPQPRRARVFDPSRMDHHWEGEAGARSISCSTPGYLDMEPAAIANAGGLGAIVTYPLMMLRRSFRALPKLPNTWAVIVDGKSFSSRTIREPDLVEVIEGRCFPKH